MRKHKLVSGTLIILSAPALKVDYSTNQTNKFSLLMTAKAKRPFGFIIIVSQ